MSKNNYINNHKAFRIVSDEEVINFIGEDNCVIVKRPNLHKDIHNFASILKATTDEMTYCSTTGKQGADLIDRSNASIIICPLSLKENAKFKENCTLIFVQNPRLWFIRCLAEFGQSLVAKKNPGIHPSAMVETENIGKGVYVGPNCHIEHNVTIGDGTIIHGGVYIYDNTMIGRNVIINSGVVIGEDGFGFEKNENGEWEKFPHIGGVEIRDNIEIGANSCIDRGTLENTIIESGTMIDNQVHIAHNVKVGKNCIIVAQSLIAGSAILEDGAYVAMCACIREGIKIGRNCFVGMGAVVTKDVKPEEIVIGVPARPILRKN